MSATAKKMLRRYNTRRLTLSAIVAAWESHIIDAGEFGAIVGEAS